MLQIFSTPPIVHFQAILCFIFPAVIHTCALGPSLYANIICRYTLRESANHVPNLWHPSRCVARVNLNAALLRTS